MKHFREKIPYRKHIALIYDNDEVRDKVVTDFITQGLKEGEKVLYLFDGKDIDELKNRLKKHGVDLQNKDLIIQTAQEGYCPSGKFCIEEMNFKTLDFAEKSKQEGKKGSRGTGEMSWAFDKLKDSSELIMYESNLNEELRKVDYVALCQYDSRLYSAETILDVLKTHPFVIIEEKIIKNPFYIEPKIFKDVLKPHPL